MNDNVVYLHGKPREVAQVTRIQASMTRWEFLSFLRKPNSAADRVKLS